MNKGKLSRSSSSENLKGEADANENAEPEIKHSFYRWVILLLFANYSASNAYQWIQYSIIPTEIETFYKLEGKGNALEWLSVIYMVVYIPLIIPATWMIDRFGLRVCCIYGSIGNAVGAILKFLAAHYYTEFWLAFTGQTIAAIAQLFVLTLPPILAGIWFPADQVSTACSIGVMANQLGTAVGFLIPPLLSERLPLLFGLGAVVCSFQAILVVLFFKKEPKFSPSLGQAQRRSDLEIEIKQNGHQKFSESLAEHSRSVLRMLRKTNNLYLVLSYGLNTGTYYAVGTLLGKFVLSFDFAKGHEGEIGLDLVVAGLFGATFAGYWLDKSRAYKQTTLVMYFCSFISMIIYTGIPYLMEYNGPTCFYIAAGLLGFTMTGYLPVGFELGVELTYPENEATVSGLLNASAQFFGIFLTLGLGHLMDLSKPVEWLGGSNVWLVYSNGIGCLVLLVGFVVTWMIKEELNRQNVNNA